MTEPDRPVARIPAEPHCSTVSVQISNTQAILAPDGDSLTALVGSVLRGEGVGQAQISLALVDDQSIRRINKRHLDHDWATDVISFLLSDPDDPELIGELVVSAEMASATAEELGADPASELALYIVHGLLHLCGYEDGSESEIRRMRKREDEVLLREGFTNTFSLFERRRAQCEGREQTPCSG
jgi:probable rRNA maturation factor